MEMPRTGGSAEDRAPYRPFAGGPFKLSLGLMPLVEARWFEPDADFSAHLAEKRALLATRPDEIFAALPAAHASAAELLSLVAEHLPRHHPELFRRDRGMLENRATGERWALGSGPPHPLDLCGRLVQEDFCLLLADEGAYRLAGASLAAPARWRLAEKLGHPLAALHGPVPGYREALARPVERFIAHLKDGRLAWRLNWGLVDHPARFQPAALQGAGPIEAENAGRSLWLRVERQTFRKLPRTGAVVFTIRTHITRLDRAVEEKDMAAALAEAVRTMPPEMQSYKQIAPFAAALLAWLDRRLRA